MSCRFISVELGKRKAKIVPFYGKGHTRSQHNWIVVIIVVHSGLTQTLRRNNSIEFCFGWRTWLIVCRSCRSANEGPSSKYRAKQNFGTPKDVHTNHVLAVSRGKVQRIAHTHKSSQTYTLPSHTHTHLTATRTSQT